ncbi:MAG: hypothetical protein AB8B78_08275 [Polaribacter sp.]
MRNIIYFLLIPFLFSCSDSYNKETSDIKTKTIIRGNVSDFTRGFPVENFKIVFNRYWDGWSVVQYAQHSEFIDSVRTDLNGNYEIIFDYIKDEKYGFKKQYYGSPYYTDFINGSKIIAGEENTQDIDAWYPTILKLNVKVRNNDYPHLRISNSLADNNYSSIGPVASFYKRDVDSIVYLKSKPNSNIKLKFYYSTGNSNSDFHSKDTMLRTSLLDTINLSYIIDCNTF